MACLYADENYCKTYGQVHVRGDKGQLLQQCQNMRRNGIQQTSEGTGLK